MDTPLGGHGDPIKLLVDGRPLYVCCQGCISQVEENPHYFVNKAAQRVNTAQIATRQPAQPSEHNHATPADRVPQRLPSQSPELSPPPAYAGNVGQRPVPSVVVGETTAADEAAIRAQGNCPVMKQPLGAHGKPVKLLVDGQPVFVCCKGCIYKIKKDPTSYVSQVVHKQPLNQNTRENSWFYESPPPVVSQSGTSCCSSGQGASCH